MLSQYYRINQAAGIGIILRHDGTVNIHSCSIIAKGNQLDIDQKILNIQTIEGMAKHLPAKTVVALNLSGKGVLHKRIEKTAIINQGNFSQILPNARLDDFYIQNFISEDWSFVSVIRRTEANKWIEQLKRQDLMTLSLSLGPFPAAHILPQLNIYGKEVRFSGNIIELNEQKHWISYHFNESAAASFALKVESEGIDEKLVIPYAAAFQLIFGTRLVMIQANIAFLENKFRTKLGDQKLRVNGALILFAFFILLLINLVIFSWLDSSNARLATQASQFVQSTNSMENMSEQVKKKEILLQSLGWDEGINKSWLIDQLASLMPEEISWKEITVNPVDLNSGRMQRTLLFFSRRISVSGTASQIIPVNEWIARIKTRPWVKKIQMESYAYNNELGTGQFHIILDY